MALFHKYGVILSENKKKSIVKYKSGQSSLIRLPIVVPNNTVELITETALKSINGLSK